nr:hypothetical protein Iba_chr02bCG13700 [Ipomoea batatas]GMC64506.1 hypothetical protein Iba_chr02dCG5610 [Ipomoea batatas]GMC66475.1 hypothetical protein Iba_chr02eCG6080 [Ipomoea batatas]
MRTAQSNNLSLNPVGNGTNFNQSFKFLNKSEKKSRKRGERQIALEEREKHRRRRYLDEGAQLKGATEACFAVNGDAIEASPSLTIGA